MGGAVGFERIYNDHGRAREDVFAAARSPARSRPGRVATGLVVRRRFLDGMARFLLSEGMTVLTVNFRLR